MKIYEVVCNCNSVGFYFSRAKALAKVRREIIIENEFDYPEYNPQFLKMVQEIDETGYTAYGCHDYAIYEGNIIDDDEDKVERSTPNMSEPKNVIDNFLERIEFPSPAEAAEIVKDNFNLEVINILDGIAEEIKKATVPEVSFTMKAPYISAVCDALTKRGYTVNKGSKISSFGNNGIDLPYTVSWEV